MTTELLTDNSNTGGLSRSFVRDGIAGNYQIVYAMIRLIRDGVRLDKGLETFAAHLLTNERQDGYSKTEDKLRTIYDYIHTNIAYIPDIAGHIESLKDARVTLSDGYGDCDDQTVLVATLLGLIGFEDVRIALARFNNEATFSHVYVVAYENGKRYVMDTSLPNGSVNKEIPATEVKEIGVFSEVPGFDGISGIVNNTRHAARKIAKAAIEFAPAVADHVPFGFIANSAFATGAQMLGAAQDRHLSLNTIASNINQGLDKLILSLMSGSIALEVAKAHALKEVSQLSAIEYSPIGQHHYQIIKGSIQQKLDFIKNFENYAIANNIPVVHLNAQAMLLSGAVLTGAVAYMFYQGHKKRTV